MTRVVPGYAGGLSTTAGRARQVTDAHGLGGEEPDVPATVGH